MIFEGRLGQLTIPSQHVEEICVKVETEPRLFVEVVVVEHSCREVEVDLGGAPDGEEGGWLTTQVVGCAFYEWAHHACSRVDQVKGFAFQWIKTWIKLAIISTIPGLTHDEGEVLVVETWQDQASFKREDS